GSSSDPEDSRPADSGPDDPDGGAGASDAEDSPAERQEEGEESAFEDELFFEGEDSDSDFEAGIFVNSLDELEEEDIPLSETALEAARTSPFEYIRRIMFWGFLAAFLVSSFLFVRNLIQKQQAAKIYRDIQEEFFSTGFSFDVSEAFRTDRSQTPGLEEDREQHTIRTMTDLLEGAENEAFVTAEVPEENRVVNEDLERKRAFLQNMIRRNSDVYGHIIVPNTKISYPVCRGKDNDYYLNHAVTGEYNPVGCVFADYRCESSITKNFNTVFYGHNIENTDVSMFHDVTLFFQKEYFENYYIYVYTMDGLYIYEPFAVYEAAYDDEYFRVTFASADEFVEFAADAQTLSEAKDPETFELLSKEFVFTDKDRILTLSTCTNGYYTQRYALHAKLIRTILE
ncbi:MAG: sortase, partial [Clostridia bacterium]|nr:sortase [Clostridia bacterium]